MCSSEESRPANADPKGKSSAAALADAASSFQESGQRLVFFAAERTLLAWIRAGIALVALGFVIERLSVVLLKVSAHPETLQNMRTFSFWCGAACVFLGALMNVVAALRYFRFVRAYRRTGSTDPGRGLEAVIVFAVAVAAMGLSIVGWLFAILP